METNIHCHHCPHQPVFTSCGCHHKLPLVSTDWARATAAGTNGKYFLKCWIGQVNVAMYLLLFIFSWKNKTETWDSRYQKKKKGTRKPKCAKKHIMSYQPFKSDFRSGTKHSKFKLVQKVLVQSYAACAGRQHWLQMSQTSSRVHVFLLESSWSRRKGVHWSADATSIFHTCQHK